MYRWWHAVVAVAVRAVAAARGGTWRLRGTAEGVPALRGTAEGVPAAGGFRGVERDGRG